MGHNKTIQKFKVKAIITKLTAQTQSGTINSHLRLRTVIIISNSPLRVVDTNLPVFRPREKIGIVIQVTKPRNQSLNNKLTLIVQKTSHTKIQ